MKKVGKRCMNLRKYNITFVVVIAVQCLVMVFNFWNLEKEFNIYVDSSNEYSVVSKAAINLQTGSDYLTEQVRYFVITRDIGHMKNYFEERDVTKRRETAIEELKKQQHANQLFLNQKNLKILNIMQCDLWLMLWV